jgi:hypothetical protein
MMNSDISSYVWGDLFIAIVTVDFPKNKTRVRNLQSHLKRSGYGQGCVFYGEKAKSVKERNDLVFKGHYNVCKWFMENRPCKHLLILEDDAYICQKRSIVKIKKYIRYMDINSPEWFVLNLGCVSSKMMKYVKNDLYNGSGYASHSYIINGNTLGEYIDIIPSEKWKAPNCVEHWGSIPYKNTYMLHPMLFTQDVHFSGLIYMLLPGVNNSHILLHYINNINRLNIYRWYILSVFILFILIYILKSRLNLFSLNSL